jgi:hypothetical protein
MSLPLKLNWMGGETKEICELLKPFHPLIIVTPALSAESPPFEFALPGSISRVWDLRSSKTIDSLGNEATEVAGKFHFEITDLQSNTAEKRGLDDFYTNLYLNNTALLHLENMTEYNYAEKFHRDILSQKFFALARVTKDGETVAGCLLRYPTVKEKLGYQERFGNSSADESESVLMLDALCCDARFNQAGLIWLTISQTARWAQSIGYSYLSTIPASPVTVIRSADKMFWNAATETVPVLHSTKMSWLYCDLNRCSYLEPDIYFYCYENGVPCFNYVANRMVEPLRLASLLNSVIGVNKKVYTRHVHFREIISDKNIEWINL